MRLREHILVSSCLLTVCSVLWGLTEIITIFSSTDFEHITYRAYLSILAFPLILYGVAGFLAGVVFALLLYLLLGKWRGSFSLRRGIPFYSILYFLPLLLGLEYLWNRRYLTGIPMTDSLSLLHSLAIFTVVILAAVLGGRLIHWVIQGSIFAVRILAVGLILAGIAGSYLLLAPTQEMDRPAPKSVATTDRPNVLLITIDTLRADHLGCYSGLPESSPRIDALAAGGVRFSRATSHVPLTLPSHTSILTSTHPPIHGVRDNARYRFGDTLPTLTEYLKEAGCRTAAFISAFVLDSRFGLDRGFDVYDDEIQNQSFFYFTTVSPPFALAGAMKLLGLTPPYKPERKADRTTEEAITWLEANREGRFFLWVHYFDPHGPLNPPAPYDTLYLAPDKDAFAFRRNMEHFNSMLGRSDARLLTAEEIEGIRTLYRGEVTYTDHHVGRLLDTLESLGIADRTLTVLTADHGQSIAEHEYIGHSFELYQDIMNVPLIFHQPGRIPAGQIVDNLVQSIDIMPTILRYAGMEVPETCRGRDLSLMIRSGAGLGEDPSAYLETFHPQPMTAKLAGLMMGGYKYIRALEGDREELYHLDRDPGETMNLASHDPVRTQAMRKKLQDLMENMESYAVSHEIPLDPQTTEAMKALGYIQ
jgi:arylsulfatase A-like enzyme